MSEVYRWFTGLITISGFLYFMTGFASAYVVHCARMKMRHRKINLSWQVTGIVVGIVAILVTSVQSSEAYNTAKQTAADNQRCMEEFFGTLENRSSITSENDELSQEQRRIVFDWIHDLIFPPPPFDSMEPESAGRQDYYLLRTTEAEEKFRVSLERQDKLQAWRAANPYPKNKCGT